MVKTVIGWFDSAWTDAGTRLRSIGAASHGHGDNASHLLRRLDKMPVGKMCVARRGSVPSMTDKEEAHDYRYFPDPDLLPLTFTQAFVDNIRDSLPELPDEKKVRFESEYGISASNAGVLVAERENVLVLTGCRRNEILGLRWDDLNFDSGEMRLRDSKTGPRMAPMPSAAAEVFRGLSRTPNNPWVFPGRKWGAHLSNLNDSWDCIRKRAGLNGVRLHDLRHTFASRALALGETLPVIGKLLGHSDIETTARYAHLARDSILDAAERIAGSIATDIL